MLRHDVVDLALVSALTVTMRSRIALSKPNPQLLSAALLVLVTSALALLVGPAVASAHTGFESSTPGDEAVLVEPVNEVTIVFTGVAIPVGDKFTALDPAGLLRSPSDVFSGDGKTFVLTFDPPLAGGQVGVRWSVQAPDSHPIEGTFVFTVNAPVETITLKTVSATSRMI